MNEVLHVLTLEPPRTQTLISLVDDEVQVGNLTVKTRANRALWRDQLVNLTLTEFKIVKLLADRAGGDVSYRELYDLVHGRGFIAGNGHDGYKTNVRTFIKHIRVAFKEIDPGFDSIKNYPGFGYQWRGNAESNVVSRYVSIDPQDPFVSLVNDESQLPQSARLYRRIGGLEIDGFKGEVRWKQNSLLLSKTEFQFLSLLTRKQNTVIAFRLFWVVAMQNFQFKQSANAGVQQGRLNAGARIVKGSIEILIDSFRQVDPGFDMIAAHVGGWGWKNPDLTIA